MSAPQHKYTKVQLMIARILSWIENLQEAITAIRFEAASIRARKEVKQMQKLYKQQHEIDKEIRKRYTA